MRISIVTISFNQARFLDQCLQSVLHQGYDELEYIVVDPGSIDLSRQIIERYRNRISSIIFEPDSGPADGLNKGFSVASGEVFGYLNADDILLPGALKRVANWFQEDPWADVIYGNAVVVDSETRILRRMLSTRWSLKAYAYGNCNVAQQATFMRKRAFRAAGGFNVANETCWDGELLVDLSLSGARFSRRPDAIGGFRLHQNSITGSGKLGKKIASDGQRIFLKVMGRNRVGFDRGISLGLWVWKLLSHPLDTTTKIFDLLPFRRRRLINERA